MASAREDLGDCSTSPVQSTNKHTATPMRTRRKTSRRERGIDVHTSSTPTVHRSPRLQRSSQASPGFFSANFGSPSSSIPCSQDNRPDVVWDFTSPKLPKGSRKKDFKITVQELLENLNHCQTPECNSQSATYSKLLENWMSKQPVETIVKKVENNKKELKRRSRRRIEELTKFINSIQKPQVTECESDVRLQSISEKEQIVNCDNAVESNADFKNSFLEGGGTDDSSEELWGDMDNSFIVKATQELDKVAVISTSGPVTEIVSTIPATEPDKLFPKSKSPPIVPESYPCDQHSDLLHQLTNVDWGEFNGDDDWENGFLVEEDDDWSLIPDDVLSGKCITKEEEKNCSSQSSVHELPNIPNTQLFNSFEDDSFEDESLLCQPDVLSRIDEVECSMLSQPKCTPDEIRKKKNEAIRRRKSTKLRKKT